MNENNNNLLTEGALLSIEENDQEPYIYMGPTPPSNDLNDDEKPRKGFTLNWTNLLIGVALFLWWLLEHNGFANDGIFYLYLYLAIVIFIHELGHLVIGKSFGCHIEGVQLFFFPFVSYSAKRGPKGYSWRNIVWRLGILPLGGITMFKSRETDDENVEEIESKSQGVELIASDSPYIEDKPAWQRLLISAAGVLFNFATFFIIYLVRPYLPNEYFNICWPIESLSLLLAVLNFLPVYPLDGRAVMFSLYEMITGKKPSPSFIKVCTVIGIIFIFLFFWIFPELFIVIMSSVFIMFF